MRRALLPTAISQLAPLTAKTGRSSKTRSTSVHSGCFRSSASIICVSSNSLFIVLCNWVWADTSRSHRTALGQATFVRAFPLGCSNGLDGEIKRSILPNRWAISRSRRSRSHGRSLAAGARETEHEVNRATERDDAPPRCLSPRPLLP